MKIEIQLAAGVLLLIGLLIGFLIGLLNQPAWASGPGGVILQYHHIGTDTPAATSIEPAQFERHMDYIAEQGFLVWSLPRLVAALTAGEAIPENVISITFDDAYLSIYEQAFPILRARGWPFSIFVSTHYIRQEAHDSALASTQISALTNPDLDFEDHNSGAMLPSTSTDGAQFLSWQQLLEMRSFGASILNHTHSHSHLLRRLNGESAAAWQARVRDQINHAQDLLTQHLGVTPKLLAYPYGEYNATIVSIARDLGYVGFGQQSGAAGQDSDLGALPRFPLSGIYSDMEGLRLKLNTWPLPLKSGGRDPMLDPSETRPKLDLRFSDSDLPLEQLVCYGPGGPTELNRISRLHFQARSIMPLSVGRSRYNCTLPVAGSKRFYWFSQLWILRNPDGSWYAER